MIESIYEYFRQCPLLNNERISIDYLGEEAVEYAIEVPPFESLIKRYADGGALKQFAFTFGSRDYYGADIMQNLENSGFYNKLEAWIHEQNKIENLPTLGEKQIADKIVVDTPGYLFGATADTARYQIQMRLIYLEEY